MGNSTPETLDNRPQICQTEKCPNFWIKTDEETGEEQYIACPLFECGSREPDLERLAEEGTLTTSCAEMTELLEAEMDETDID